MGKFARRRGEDEEVEATEKHLQAGIGLVRTREGEAAGPEGSEGPGERGGDHDDHGEGRGVGCVRGVEGEHDDSDEAESDAAEGERGGAQGAEDEDFSGANPDGDEGENDGGESGGDAGFSPEEACVVEGEHDEAEGGGGEERAAVDVDGAGEAAPYQEDEAGKGEAECGGKEGRDRVRAGDQDADGEEGAAPEEIDGGVGEDLRTRMTGYRLQVTGCREWSVDSGQWQRRAGGFDDFVANR